MELSENGAPHSRHPLTLEIREKIPGTSGGPSEPPPIRSRPPGNLTPPHVYRRNTKLQRGTADGQARIGDDDAVEENFNDDVLAGILVVAVGEGVDERLSEGGLRILGRIRPGEPTSG